MDEEMVISAIKNYAAFKDKDLNRLAAYAETFRVSKVLKQYMDGLWTYIGVPRKELSYVLYVKKTENLYDSFDIPKKWWV